MRVITHTNPRVRDDHVGALHRHRRLRAHHHPRPIYVRHLLGKADRVHTGRIVDGRARHQIHAHRGARDEQRAEHVVAVAHPRHIQALQMAEALVHGEQVG